MANPRLERGLIRILVGSALSIALLALLLVPVPRDATGDPDLPAVAFEQVGLYRLEIALLVFYGDLLLITPAFSGLIWGRLPTEISVRGAKFTERTDRSADSNRAAVEELERATRRLAEGLDIANFEIKRLKEKPRSDSTQPEVESKR
jgi:hypothetical protein